MTYRVHINVQAHRDIYNVFYYIENELFNPMAAKHFIEGIYAKIYGLKLNAGIFAISSYGDVLKYDDAARHVTCKGFTIIYSIHGGLVVVHRVIHGSLIRK